MTSDYLESIYAQMGQQLDPDESYFERDSRFAALEEVLLSLPPGKLLDAGCGRGLLLRRLSKRHDCYGSDFDAGAVMHCQGSGLKVCQIDLNTSITLDPSFPTTFDAIVISEVCEHLLNPRSALALAERTLAPKGTLIVTVPNAVPLLVRSSVLAGREVSWLHYPSADTEATGHIRFYTVSSMTRLLREAGFMVDAVRGVSFRMNGRFWERFCYWFPRIFGRNNDPARTKTDAWLGRHLPSFSPGLLFVCQRLPAIPPNTNSPAV